MSGQALSGKWGTGFIESNKICDLGKWTWEDSHAIPKYASNCTNGYKETVDGVGDGKGTIEVKIQKNGRMPAAAGQLLTLNLHVDDSNENYVSVMARVASKPLEVDINEGAPVSCTYALEGHGAPTYYGILQDDDTAPCCGSSSGE